jgi:hypothetical protein
MGHCLIFVWKYEVVLVSILHSVIALIRIFLYSAGSVIASIRIFDIAPAEYISFPCWNNCSHVRHALQGLLVAHELRASLLPGWLPPLVWEAPFVLKILEAITTAGCRDSIDSERYELLGDAVLKLVSSVHVYKQEAHRCSEGEMTFLQNKYVSNKNLFNVALVCPFSATLCVPWCARCLP